MGIRKRYTEKFKKKVIEDYMNSTMSMGECVRKHGVVNRSSLSRWLQECGCERAYWSSEEMRIRRIREKCEQETEELRQRIRELEQTISELRQELSGKG